MYFEKNKKIKLIKIVIENTILRKNYTYEQNCYKEKKMPFAIRDRKNADKVLTYVFIDVEKNNGIVEFLSMRGFFYKNLNLIGLRPFKLYLH